MTMTECYNDILSRRSGEREALPEISSEEYRRRLKGAFFGRMAGCTLGAPVEGWTLEQIRDYTIENGCDPTDEEYRESAQALQAFRSQQEHTFSGEMCL